MDFKICKQMKTIYATEHGACTSYLEDGKLVPAKLIKCSELNEDGRYTINELGIFPFNPNNIEITEHKSMFDKTWFSYSLTVAGWEELEKAGLKHPGRGWVEIEFLSEQRVKDMIQENETLAANFLKYSVKLRQLLLKS